MNEREAAVHFYEMLTGVFNDDQSKITRYVCFAVLFVGMVWAGFNYFRANLLADTDTPIDPDMFQDTRMPSNESAVNRVIELAQAVETVRRGGDSIAAAMDGLHNMPFNTPPEGLEIFDTFSDASPGVSNVPGNRETPNIPMSVKMIMTANDGEKIAVVDAGGKKAVVLRLGDRLPDDSGFVSAIRPNGITVIVNKQEVKYEIPEIPKYNEIRSPARKRSRK